MTLSLTRVDAEQVYPAAAAADIGGGIRLHYVQEGSGPTIVFVHGSLSDYSYWSDQLPQFATHYHVIAYSRRYNYPNDNPAHPGTRRSPTHKTWPPSSAGCI